MRTGKHNFTTNESYDIMTKVSWNYRNRRKHNETCN